MIRAGAGPVRDLWLDRLRGALLPGTPWRRLPPGTADDRLLGGLDLAATLRTGRPVVQAGLLAEADGGFVVVPMAERLSPGTVARLCAALDTGTLSLERDGLSGARPARFGLVLLDEGDADEAVADALIDRLAFRVELSGLGLREIGAGMVEPRPSRGESRAAAGERDASASGTALTAHEGTPMDAIAALCAVASDLGGSSLRGPLLAARVARLAARLDGRETVGEADAVEAARLVLAPRATCLPENPVPIEPPAEAAADLAEPTDAPGEAQAPPSDAGAAEDDAGPSPTNRDEIVLEAARAAIPANLLAQLLAGGPRLRAAKSGRMGAAASAPRSGRPAGSRPGDPRRGRLDLIATLRAAAPWQRIRQAQARAATSHAHPHSEVRGEAEPRRTPPVLPAGSGGLSRGRFAAPQDDGARAISRIVVLPDDLRIKRLVQRAETTAIFCVDASGSAALERLAEAKGAVELLLAESYVRRDRVALIAFRGTGAEVLLAPTRSLVRAKRALRDLPGGGGTPLAAGIDAAAALGLTVRRAGGSPVLVILTDGRANVARSGEGGRLRAGEEALTAARTLRTLSLPTLVIDTGARPEAARRLAEAAQARYIPLPYADASGLSTGISAAVRAAIG